MVHVHPRPLGRKPNNSTNNKLLRTGQAYHNYTTIQTPTDGRAFANNHSIETIMRTETNIGNFNEGITVGMANPPVYSSVREIDTVILLLTVLTILIVTCTALIAASIFLSARKPYDPTQNNPKPVRTPLFFIRLCRRRCV